MAGVGSTQSIRKALGAIKDTTTVGLAKVNSEYKDLDIAIVKATNHVEHLMKEKHLKTIFNAVSASRPRADVGYCINALARRLAKTHNWAVALKTLFVIHRALREVDPSFREELVSYTNTRRNMLNLSHFKDDSSPKAWDYSAWVRTYALYLEERLECFRILKYDVQIEESIICVVPGAFEGFSATRDQISEALPFRRTCYFQRTSNLDAVQLLEQISALQQLLYRLLGCKPEGAALHNNIIKYVLSLIAGESIKIYNSINQGTLHLVDMFFEMQCHDSVRSLEIYRKAGRQAESLSDFFEFCKCLEPGRCPKFPKIEQPPALFIAAMEEYVKDASRVSPLNQTGVKNDGEMTPGATLAIEHDKASNENDEPQPCGTPTELPAAQASEVPGQALTSDLMGLDDFTEDAAEMEEINSLALAITDDDNEPSDSDASFSTDASNGGS